MWMTDWAEDGRGRGRQNGERRTEWVDDGRETGHRTAGREDDVMGEDDGMRGE
jgi:hypothetical protein